MSMLLKLIESDFLNAESTPKIVRKVIGKTIISPGLFIRYFYALCKTDGDTTRDPVMNKVYYYMVNSGVDEYRETIRKLLYFEADCRASIRNKGS